jgi:hypothetical protein
MQEMNAFPAPRLTGADSYPYIRKAAGSYMTGFNDAENISGQAAFDWIADKLRHDLYLTDPTWALIPRESNTTAGVALHKNKKAYRN